MATCAEYVIKHIMFKMLISAVCATLFIGKTKSIKIIPVFI